MANIPLAQVPNAPQTGSNAVPLPVGAIRAADIEYMGVVEDASYMAIGRAYQNLGAAGQQAASVLGDFGLSMARASDEANLAKADSIKTELLSKYYTETQRMPEDQWQSHWQSKYQDRLASEVGGMKMTTRDGANRRDTWLQSTQSAVSADIYVKSNQSLIGRARMEFDNGIERKIENGDYEGAFALIARRGLAGLSNPEEDERDKLKIERAVKWETIEQKVSTDAPAAAKELQQAVDENKEHPNYPELKTQADRVKALRAARGFERENITRYSSEGLERVLQGEFQSAEEIEKAYTGLLPTREIEELKATLLQTPEEVAKRVELYRPVLAMIEAYDPSTDKDLSARMEIRRAIRQVETGFQLDLVNTLNDKVRQNKPLPPTSITTIRKDLEARLKAGEYGQWKVDSKGNPRNPAERAKYEAAMLSYGQEATAFNEWARRNPNASDADAFTEINRIRTDQYKRDKAAGRDPKMPAAMQAPKLEDIESEIRRRRSSTGAPADGAAKATVRNNNAGAMWYVGGWQKKFGAEFGENLNDGLGQGNQIAKFPSPTHGAAALIYQLNRPSYADKTVRGAISRWSGGNSVSSYLKVLGDAGFSPDQQVSEILASPEGAVAFAKAMARHETGYDYPLDDNEWQEAYQMSRQA
jgi:hypothetical protein